MIIERPIVLIPRDSSEGTNTLAAGDAKLDQMRQRFDTQALTPVSNTQDGSSRRVVSGRLWLSRRRR